VRLGAPGQQSDRETIEGLTSMYGNGINNNKFIISLSWLGYKYGFNHSACFCLVHYHHVPLTSPYSVGVCGVLCCFCSGVYTNWFEHVDE
jgi:hypothetical protein